MRPALKRVPTRREREILEAMATDKTAFIWYLNGRTRDYPAFCQGRKSKRILRVTLHHLLDCGWVTEQFSPGHHPTGAYFLTVGGRAQVEKRTS